MKYGETYLSPDESIGVRADWRLDEFHLVGLGKRVALTHERARWLRDCLAEAIERYEIETTPDEDAVISLLLTVTTRGEA